MNIGIFTKTFLRPTFQAVLDAVEATGLRWVQLNMESAGFAPMPEELSAEEAQEIGDALAARRFQVAAVQGTFNMSHPDPEHRHHGLQRLGVLLAACPHLRTSCVAICIGTRDRENMWRHHPENRSAEAWKEMVSCVRTAVQMAEQVGVTLALEPEVSNVVDSAAAARRLMDEISSPYLKVTMDGANLFHAGQLPSMAEVLDEAFAQVGRDIVLAHAKDILHDGEAGQEAAGHGLLDYDRYLKLLQGSSLGAGPILLHGLTEEQAPGCIAFLQGKLAAFLG